MKALGPRQGRTPVVVAGAVVTLAITLGFLLMFWNRFLGLRSGDGAFSAAILFLDGAVPYRDFYNPGPPLFLLRCAALLAAFGKTMMVLRVAAIVERLLLAGLLYAWLVRFFKAGDAALAAMVTMVVSTLDISDPLSSYNHFSMLMGVAAGYASSFALDEKRSQRGLLLSGAVAGGLAFLSMACKQTIGLAVTVALPVIVGLCLIRLEGVRRFAAYLAGYIGAWCATLAVLLSWFVHMGLLRSFLRMIFVTGPAAKSTHPIDFWIRTLFVMRHMQWEAWLGLIGCLICWRMVDRSGRREQREPDTSFASWLQIAGVLLLGVGAIALSYRVPHYLLDDYVDSSIFGPIVTSFQIVRSLIYVVLFGTAVVGLFYFGLYLVRGLSRRQSQFLLFTAVSFCCAFMLSLSYPAFEAMTVPGLALLLAALLDEAKGWRRWPLYLICLAVMIFDIQVKMETPFAFAGWPEPPVAMANQRSTLPELRGMLLPRSTVDFVDTTVHIIQQNSAPGDTIFVYPEFAFLYGASHRMPATFAISHNIDVVPDSMAREEAARLLLHPPAVLIYGWESDGFLIGQERLWRNSQPSGQRELIAAVKTLAAQYHLAARFAPYARAGFLSVYVRPDRWRGADGAAQKAD
jgi:hypothetical protein